MKGEQLPETEIMKVGLKKIVKSHQVNCNESIFGEFLPFGTTVRSKQVGLQTFTFSEPIQSVLQ